MFTKPRPALHKNMSLAGSTSTVFIQEYPSSAPVSPSSNQINRLHRPSIVQFQAEVQEIIALHQLDSPEDPPDSYLGQSILVTFCCCWCLGLMAIRHSLRCREAIACGDMKKAVVQSKLAWTLVRWSIATGLAFMASIVILFLVAHLLRLWQSAL